MIATKYPEPRVTYYRDRGYLTPWGSAQTRYEYAPGVSFYSCAGHGGVKVNKEPNQQIPAVFRNEDGWYEEDCESLIVFHFLLSDDQTNGLRAWFPDQWETFSGERVTAAQSSIIGRREFAETHKDDWVTGSAWGDWTDWVPAGLVGVVARLGNGFDGKSGEKRWFLVPEGEYEKRGQFGFVIDPTQHQQIPNPR